MLAVTNVPIKTENGREALAQRCHDMQMCQQHLPILIDGTRTVSQLHQLLGDQPDLDDLLVGLQRAGMVDMLPGVSPENAATTPPLDLIVYFDRPLFDDRGSSDPAALPYICDELPPLTGMTLSLQATAALIDELVTSDASKPYTAPVQAISAPQPTIPPELTDVLPNAVRIELIRLAMQHFDFATGAAMPLLRVCKEDSQSLCDVIAVCMRVTAPPAGEHTTVKFMDAAVQAVTLRH